jgi:uncharacterized protein YgbK (DUF1537 family)
MPDIAIIADDLTGAADAGVQLVRAGYRTAVFFYASELLAGDLDAIAIDTDSRTSGLRRQKGCRGGTRRPSCQPPI